MCQAPCANHLFLRKQEEFVNGLAALFGEGVTDVIAVGHNRLPADPKFTPFKVGCSSTVGDLYHG